MIQKSDNEDQEIQQNKLFTFPPFHDILYYILNALIMWKYFQNHFQVSLEQLCYYLDFELNSCIMGPIHENMELHVQIKELSLLCRGAMVVKDWSISLKQRMF